MIKNVLVLFVFFFMCSIQIKAQKNDDIVGYWLTRDDETKEPTSQIQVFKSAEGKYFGKIIWLKEPNKNGQPKLDDKNPNINKVKQPILNLQILNNFQFSGDQWDGGTIYDPKSGNTYKCKIWMEGKSTNLLYVKGYIGVSIIGKQVLWTREYKSR